MDKVMIIQKMELPLKDFSKKEWGLWMGSLFIVAISNIISPEFNLLIMIAALIGATSLLFAAKGNGWAQILIVIFSILYGIISFQFKYWGEMITYLGMTGPSHSVLGIRPELSIAKFRGDIPNRYQWANGPTKIEAVLFTIDTETGKCRKDRCSTAAGHR